MRARCAPWQWARAERKGGAVLFERCSLERCSSEHCFGETAPLQSGRSYFFFAFLAFLAAFFAFFAIVPPEGGGLVPDGDSGCVCRASGGVSVLHKPLSERASLIPDVDYGRENCDVKHKPSLLVKALASIARLTQAQNAAWSQIARTHSQFASSTSPRDP